MDRAFRKARRGQRRHCLRVIPRPALEPRTEPYAAEGPGNTAHAAVGAAVGVLLLLLRLIHLVAGAIGGAIVRFLPDALVRALEAPSEG